MSPLTRQNDSIKLLKRIQKYWRDRGHEVELRQEKFSAPDNNRTLWTIRSNMVDGRPA